jgi:DNA-binding NarL/FixJ family response regulator
MEDAGAEGRARRVCVIGENSLAARYLLRILEKDSALYPLAFDDLVCGSGPPNQLPISIPFTVFLIDRCGLVLPVAELARGLKQRFPKGRYIVLDQEQSREELVFLVGIGFHGFLAHRSVDEELLAAVHAVSEGRLWMPGEVLHSCIRGGEHLRRRALKDQNLTDEVTPRENQILDLLRQRLSNKEIAEALQIQVSTVKFHLSNIFAKRQINNRRELTEETPLLRDWKSFISSQHS